MSLTRVMASRPSRRSLAKNSVHNMSSAVKQLVDSMPSSETGACKFLKILARRLDAVKDWLNLCDSNQEIELLVCLESIYAVSHLA